MFVPKNVGEKYRFLLNIDENSAQMAHLSIESGAFMKMLFFD